MYTDNYIGLYTNIWKQAIRDDLEKIINGICVYALNKAYEEHCLIEVEPLLLGDERFDGFKQDLRKYCKLKVKDNIEKKVMENVHKEALGWPHGRKIDSREVTQAIKETRKDVTAYAVERMKKRKGRFVNAKKQSCL